MRPSQNPSGSNSRWARGLPSSRLDANAYFRSEARRLAPNPRQGLSNLDDLYQRMDLGGSGNSFPAASQRQPSASTSSRLPLLDHTGTTRLPLLDHTRTSHPTQRPTSHSGESSRRSDSEHNTRMATRQTQYQQLPLQDQQDQEQWAQNQLSQSWDKCDQGYQWIRDVGGYRCSGGSHFVTDELVAEGKGYYFQKTTTQRGAFYSTAWTGPLDRRTHHTVLNYLKYQHPPNSFATRGWRP